MTNEEILAAAASIKTNAAKATSSNNGTKPTSKMLLKLGDSTFFEMAIWSDNTSKDVNKHSLIELAKANPEAAIKVMTELLPAMEVVISGGSAKPEIAGFAALIAKYS